MQASPRQTEHHYPSARGTRRGTGHQTKDKTKLLPAKYPTQLLLAGPLKKPLCVLLEDAGHFTYDYQQPDQWEDRYTLEEKAMKAVGFTPWIPKTAPPLL